jgi:hypothetical protein
MLESTTGRRCGRTMHTRSTRSYHADRRSSAYHLPAMTATSLTDSGDGKTTECPWQAVIATTRLAFKQSPTPLLFAVTICNKILYFDHLYCTASGRPSHWTFRTARSFFEVHLLPLLRAQVRHNANRPRTRGARVLPTQCKSTAARLGGGGRLLDLLVREQRADLGLLLHVPE